MSKLIERIRREDGETKLLVECTYCKRHIYMTEDIDHCFLCGEELQSLNMAAWKEFDGLSLEEIDSLMSND